MSDYFPKALGKMTSAFPTWSEALIIVAVLGFLVWVTLRVKAWFRDDAAHSESPDNLMSQMRELHRQGELTEDEFRLIRTRLAASVAARANARANTKHDPKASATIAARLMTDVIRTESPQGRSEQPDRDHDGLTIPSTASSSTPDAPTNPSP
jgi:hypothetical protein